MTLESQYKKYQIQNPESILSFEEWKENVLKKLLVDEMFSPKEIKISKERFIEIVKEEKDKIQNKKTKGIWSFIKRKIFNRIEE